MAADPLTINGAGPGLDPGDRDTMIRTIVAEGGNSPDGMGAVANVLKNRLATGDYGDSPTAVAKAKGQFEVWSDGSAAKVDPASAQYAAAGRIVDAVASGQVPDNTGGATHFYSPSGQAARAGDGRQQVPDWAPAGSQTASIGGNVFFAPNGPVKYASAPGGATPSAQPALAVTFGGQQNAPDPGPLPAGQKAAPMAQDASDPFEAMMAGGAAKTAPAAPATAPEQAAPTADDPFEQMMASGNASAKLGSAMANPAAQPAPISFGGPPANAPQDKGAVGSAVAGALNGVPVAGPTLLSGAQKAAAAVASLRYGDSYADELKRIQGDVAATTAAHPIANTVGQVGGAVLGMAPLAAAAPEALGLQGTSMLGRMGAGAASNALLGAADADARGQDPASGALFGGLGGGLGAPIGALAGRLAGQAAGGVNMLMGAAANKALTGTSSGVAGLSRPAANLLSQAIAADGPEAVQSAVGQLGDLGMIADAGPSTRGLAGGLALRPGDAKSTVENALTARANGASDRISGQIDASLGPFQDAQTATNDLNQQRAALVPAYTAAHAAAPPVDVSNVVEAIDRRLDTATGAQRTALQRLRGELVATPATVEPETGQAIPETYVTNSRQLQNLRQDLDGVINHGTPGLGVEGGAVMRNQAALRDIRGSLDGALKDQVPGLRDLDGQSAGLARQAEAVESGTGVFRGNGPSPETLTAQRVAMSPDEQAAQNLGARADIDRMFGRGTQRQAVTLNKLLPASSGGEGYNASNMATMFGQDQTNALTGALTREQIFNSTADEVMRNSATARRQAAGDLLKETQPGSLNLSSASLPGLAVQGVKSALVDPFMRAIMETPNAPRNLEIARALTAQGANRDDILRQLVRLNGQNNALGALGNSLTSGVTGSANRLTMAAPLVIHGQPQPAN